MFSNIIFKALLKISKENTKNNYKYSDIDFPEHLIKLKTKRDKQEKILNYKNIFGPDKYYSQRRSQNISKNNSPTLLKRKNLKIYNNENNEGFSQKKIIISKNEKDSSFPKVNNFNSRKNFSHIKRVKFNISKNNFNKGMNKNRTLQLTPKKKNNIVFDRNIEKKIINNFNVNSKELESNSAINIHVLKINAPKDEIKKDLLSISRNILSQQKFFEDKNRIIKNLIALNSSKKRAIQLKWRERDKNGNKMKEGLFQKLYEKLEKEKKKKIFTKKINFDNLSFSVPKPNTMNHFRPKILTMMTANNFKNKFISIEDIDNIVIKKKEEFPLYKKISSHNYNLYYYSINRMYASQIKEYMKHRINWINVSDRNDLKYITINFSWRYSNRLYYKQYKYDPEIFTSNNSYSIKKLKMINLFERNYEVGNKKYMFLNLINYCDKINLNVFEIVPFTIIINNTPDLELCFKALNEILLFVASKWDQNINLITNRKYDEHFWFDKNYQKIKNQIIYINKNFLSKKNYWIVKPTDLYQGKCINIFTTFEQIYKQCKNIFRGVDKRAIPNVPIKDDKEEEDENDCENCDNIYCENESVNTTNKKKTFSSRMYCSNEIIIQKYLDNPLLYKNRKFDIRCFVLVDYHLNIYFFKEGHLKASSELYNINKDNRFIHITNYSLQKKSEKFEIYEEGNEISYNDFKKYLKSQNISLDNFDKMINKMKLLVEISMKAVGKKLLKTNPVLSFEIFGYDFIIDNEFQPWILEINNNPGLVISSAVIQKIIPRMLDDAFRLTIDKVFDTRYDNECIDENGKYKSKFSIEGYDDEENIFEFLCNIK